MGIAEALEKDYLRLEQQLMGVGDAMPAEHYGFKPTIDVRSFGEQLRHVAAVQWFIGAALMNREPPVDVGDGDSGPTSMTGKAEILAYVAASFAYLREAIRGMSNDDALETIPHPFDSQITMERMTIVGGYASHGWEHYGQMVVYLRLNEVVPPSSR